MIGHFARELEKMSAVKGGRGAPRRGKGTPAGVTQPSGEPGAPQAPSVGAKVSKFKQSTSSWIRRMDKKPTAGKFGKWG